MTACIAWSSCSATAHTASSSEGAWGRGGGRVGVGYGLGLGLGLGLGVRGRGRVWLVGGRRAGDEVCVLEGLRLGRYRGDVGKMQGRCRGDVDTWGDVGLG